MYFTLIPVAALLLMLAGIGLPAHAAVPGQTAESRMRALLGLDGNPDANSEAMPDALPAPEATAETGLGVNAALSVDAGLSPEFAAAAAVGRSACRGQLPYAQRVSFAWRAGLHARRAVAAPGAFEAKQYRTRFRVAGGAYLAAGPPATVARART